MLMGGLGGRFGVAVIGCGRIGSLRAHLTSRHPSVDFLGVCDVIESKAIELARKLGANCWSTDFREILARPEVKVVIVATSEENHFQPALKAIESGRPVLVEKPFVIDLTEAKELLKKAEQHGVDIFVGYTQRFRRHFLNAKEKIKAGYLKQVNSAFGKIYYSQYLGEVMLSRAPKATPSLNALAYILDILLWYLEGRRPVTVYAQPVWGNFREKYNVPDATWAIITFDDGAVATVGASAQLPKHYPAAVSVLELELFGSGGMVSIDYGHKEAILASTTPNPSPYTPEVQNNVTFLGSPMPGDWTLGYFSGPMKEETEAFFESVSKGIKHPLLATGSHAYRVVELSLAIDKAALSGKVLHRDEGSNWLSQ